VGTRGLIAIVQDGIFKLAMPFDYDAYPAWHGLLLVYHLQAMDIDRLARRVSDLTAYTEADIAAARSYCDVRERDLSNAGLATLCVKYPALFRDTASNILPMIYFGSCSHVLVTPEFACDGLSCEYAYVINLDSSEFEVYVGGVDWSIKRGILHGPFAYLRRSKPPAQGLQGACDYVPVVRVVAFKLAMLRMWTARDFLLTVDGAILRLREKNRRACRYVELKR
jgi:hypothetical protein